MLGLSLCTAPMKPPAAASAVGFNTLTFIDTFTSLGSIDTAKTGSSGFNWYITNSWPNASSPAVNGGWNSITDTDPATLSVSAQMLRISAGINNIGQGVHTAVASGASWKGTGFNGTTGGAYFEIVSAFDPSITPQTTWPVAWAQDLRFLIGSVNKFVEVDLFERNGPPMTFAIHDWDMSGNPAIDNSNSGSWTANPDLSDANPHKYGTLWQTVTQGGGTGSIQRYVDDVHRSANDVTWTAGAQYSALDSAILMLILDAGGNVPTTFRVAVWQASLAGRTVQ